MSDHRYMSKHNTVNRDNMSILLFVKAGKSSGRHRRHRTCTW